MYGGKIRGYAKNSSCVLVATDGGIFRTTDQGQSWTNATQTFDPNSVNCETIVSIGNDFYAMPNYGSGIYKSTDNGVNWSPLSFSSWTPWSLGKISNTLYVVGVGQTGGQLYSSLNGSTWTPKAILWDNINTWQGGDCELLSFNQDKLYLALRNNLYYTSDGSNISTVSVSGLGITDFSRNYDIDGDALGNLYYRVNNALYKYNFTSDIWSNISTGKIPSDYQIVEYYATDNAVFLTTMNPTLDIKFYRSTNQGSTFSELTSTGLSPPMVSDIIEVSATEFIGNRLDGQIVLSSNGGSTWSLNANQYIASYAGNFTRSGNSLLFSREVTGLILSINQGLNWSIANNGIPGLSGISAYFVNQIIQVKDTLFSFLQPDPFSNNVALYKSTNNGTSWTSRPIPAPYNAGEEYSFAGKCDSALFVNYYDPVSGNYALIVSFRYGSSWVKPNSQNSSEPLYLKGPKNCLFAFYGSPYTSFDGFRGFNNVYRANNFGLSFTDINPGNLFSNTFLIKRVSGDRGDKAGPMMDFDAANNKAIFAVTDRAWGNYNIGIDRLYLYNITSNTWSVISTTGLPANYLANCIKYIGNNVWLLATNTGLYKSTNAGVTWTIAHNASNWQKGIVINSIETIGIKAFLGTMANGVWVSDLNTGILEQVKDNDLQVFPNPTDGLVNVIMPDLGGKTANVSLYGLDGKVMMTKTVQSKQFQLDLHNLASGTYLLVINSNNRIFRKSIIRN